MATDEELLGKLIRQVFSTSTDTCAEVSTALLQSLAKSLSKLIGPDGTDSLLFRVARRVIDEYPWFQFNPSTFALDPEFAELGSCLDAQELSQACAASMLFFDSLFGILGPLIGTHLTTLILKSALDGKKPATGSKEQNNE